MAVEKGKEKPKFDHHVGKPDVGHAVWQYTAGSWALKKAEPAPGFECGPPPRGPGKYEGEVRRTPCVPVRPPGQGQSEKGAE